MRKKLDRKALVSDYLADTMPIYELVKKHGITRQWLYVVLQKEGVTKRLKPEFDSTSLDENKVLASYAKTKSIRDTADELETSMTAVHTILRKHNAIARRSKYSNLIPAWKEAYENGASLYHIAKMHDTSVSTVRNRLTREGVVFRPSNKSAISNDIKKRVVGMKEDKVSLSKIAATNSISVTSVQSIIRANRESC